MNHENRKRHPSSGHGNPVFLALSSSMPRAKKVLWLSAIADAGFTPIIAKWTDVRLTPEGELVVTGVVHGPSGTPPAAIKDKTIWPSVIFHHFRLKGKSASFFQKLAERIPSAKVSWSPYFKAVSNKDYFETMLSEYEALTGRSINRPMTYIAGAGDEALVDQIKDAFGETTPVVVKPATASQGLGIKALTTGDQELLAAVSEMRPNTKYVVQEFIDSPITYRDRRVDLRVYAMVRNLNNADFSVYKKGVVKVAGVAPGSEDEPHLDAIITNASYRKKRGLPQKNLPLWSMLDHLGKHGFDQEKFWAAVDEIVGHVAKAIANDLKRNSLRLPNHFFLTGIDLILTQRDGKIVPYLLEINEAPQIDRWGSNVEPHLFPFYRNWASDMADICFRSDEQSRTAKVHHEAEPVSLDLDPAGQSSTKQLALSPARTSKPHPLLTSEGLLEATGGSWFIPPPEGWKAKDIRYYSGALQISKGDLVITKGSRDNSTHLAGNTAPGQIAQFFAEGAAAVITDQTPVESDQVGPILLVESIRKSLDHLGAAARDRLKGKVICVTGSTGKTSSKHALEALLGKQAPTFASKRSQNAPFHMALHLARTPPDTTYGVYEVPVGHWIEKISGMMRPHVVLITNIHEKHLDTMKTVRQIAIGKAKLMRFMEPGGTAVLNRDGEFFDLLAKEARKHGVSNLITFGADEHADIRVLSAEMDTRGADVEANVAGKTVRYRINIPGQHAVTNSLGVLAAVHAIGADAERAAADMAGVDTLDGRLKTYELPLPGGPFELIDDSFSATPVSLSAGLNVVSMHETGATGRRIAILGDIGSLGDDSAELHSSLTPLLLDAKIDRLYAAGDEMRHLYEAAKDDLWAYHAHDINDLYVKVLCDLNPGDLVYVKGSGSVELKVSRVVARLKRLAPGREVDSKGLRGFAIRYLKTKYLPGPNQHSSESVLQQTVSLSWISELRSGDLGPKFKERLLGRFPQLREVAVKGEKQGAFLNRVQSLEGVPIAEALLYIILAIKSELGIGTATGSIAPAGGSFRWELISECKDIELSRRISELALECFCDLLPQNIRWQAGFAPSDFDKNLETLRTFKAGRPNPDKPVLLALRRGKPPKRKSNLFTTLAQSGLDPIVAKWQDIEITNNGYAIVSGARHFEDGSEPVLVENEAIEPSLILHAFFSPGSGCTSLIKKLLKAFPKAVASWDPYFKKICQKSAFERALLNYEAATGSSVPRPLTLTARAVEPDSYSRITQAFGKAQNLIVKPTAGSHCKGIEFLRSDNIDELKRILEQDPENEFVVQRLIEDVPQLQGYRFGLRLYAMAWSLNPLQFRLYDEGALKYAGAKPDKTKPLDPGAFLVGTTYKRTHKLPDQNELVSVALDMLSKTGVDTADFWKQANGIVKGVFETVALDAAKKEVNLDRHFFFTGIDLAIEKKGDGISVLLIEVNETPAVMQSYKEIHKGFTGFFSRWGRDLHNLSTKTDSDSKTVTHEIAIRKKDQVSVRIAPARPTVCQPPITPALPSGSDDEEFETVWDLNDVVRLTGGALHFAQGARRQLGRVVYPTNMISPGAILFRTDPGAWPSRQVRLSGQSGKSLGELIKIASERDAALIVTSEQPPRKSTVPILHVANSYEALFALAEHARKRFKGHVIAVAGTSGKSTTKELLKKLLSNIGPTQSSFGNWNSVEGIAMGMASLPRECAFSVVEVSEESIQGQRGRTSLSLVRPDVAIITSVGIGATNRFPDIATTADVIARLFRTLPASGSAYWHKEIAEAKTIGLAASGRRQRILGDPAASNVRVSQLESGLDRTRLKLDLDGYSKELNTHLLGPGNMSNISLAAQCALDLGVGKEDVAMTITEYRPSKRKMDVEELTISGKPVHFVDDSYNAELLSFENMLRHLRDIGDETQRKIIVIGKIVSIDGHEEEIYSQLAKAIISCSPYAVILFGDGLTALGKSLQGKIPVLSAGSPLGVVALLETLVNDGAIVALKGSSRYTRLRELSQLVRKRGTHSSSRGGRKAQSLHEDVIRAVSHPHKVSSTTEAAFSLGIVGDTYLGECYVGTKGKSRPHPLHDNDYDSAFEKVDPFLAANDFNIANLETPLIEGKSSPYEGKRTYLHWARPQETLSSLERHNFHAVTLANNHFYDFGAAGMANTLDACKQSQLVAFGSGENLYEAARPLELDVRQTSKSSRHVKKRKVIVFSGYAYRRSVDERFAAYAQSDRPGTLPLRGTSIAEAVRLARSQNKEALILVVPHWQRDYQWASDRQRKFAEAILEAGADLVIGHGSHMLQQTERFDGRLAIHGIGNFVFNSPGRYAAKFAPRFSAAVRIVLPHDQRKTAMVHLYPFLSCNRTTGYRPRFLTEEEIAQFEEFYCRLGFVPSNAEMVKDAIGYNLAMPIR